MSTGLPAASAASRNAVRSGITTARTCPSPSNPASETDTSPGGVYVGGSAYVVSRNVESHSPYSCARAGRLPYRHRGTGRVAGAGAVAAVPEGHHRPDHGGHHHRRDQDGDDAAERREPDASPRRAHRSSPGSGTSSRVRSTSSPICRDSSSTDSKRTSSRRRTQNSIESGSPTRSPSKSRRNASRWTGSWPNVG